MNNKFGPQGQYRQDRFRSYDDYRRSRDEGATNRREFDEDREYRSRDLELETSGPYRQAREPYGEPWGGRDPRQGTSSYDGFYAPTGWGAERRGGYAGRGPKDYVRTDERIREDVCDRLSWNDEVDATGISVSVAGGEVTLEGSVETRHMKREAEDVAETVPGVSDVHNRVRVRKSMLTEVKEKLMGEDETHHYANTGTQTTGPTATHGGRS